MKNKNDDEKPTTSLETMQQIATHWGSLMIALAYSDIAYETFYGQLTEQERDQLRKEFGDERK